MWQKLIDLARLVFNFGQETRQNSEDVKDLQREVRQLTAIVQQLAYENRRVLNDMDKMLETIARDERNEREKLALRLENEMLKFERRLPQGKQNDSP